MNSQANNTLAWAGIIAAGTVVGSYGLACIFPFAAVAAVAALTMRARDGALLVLTVWLGNQAVGYGLIDYPVDSYSIGRGLALGLGAIGAYWAARSVSGDAKVSSPRSLLVLAAAFATQQAITFVDAVFSGSAENYLPSIVAQVALNDTLWFAGLSLAWLGLRQFPSVRPSLRLS